MTSPGGDTTPRNTRRREALRRYAADLRTRRAEREAMDEIQATLLPEADECPQCGSTEWELWFGGSKPAHVRCRGCKSDFTLGGHLASAGRDADGGTP